MEEARHAKWLKEINAQSNSLNTLDKYDEAKYNKSLKYQLLRGYDRCVKEGEISPLVGFDQFTEVDNEVIQRIIGQTTSTGLTIESVTPHFLGRIIGQTSTPHKGLRQGVSIDDVLETLLRPIKVSRVRELQDGDARQTYFGTKAAVTISIRDKKLIQTNPRG